LLDSGARWRPYDRRRKTRILATRRRRDHPTGFGSRHHDLAAAVEQRPDPRSLERRGPARADRMGEEDVAVHLHPRVTGEARLRMDGRRAAGHLGEAWREVLSWPCLHPLV